ncbi:MAG TPA: amidase, partial [Hellea balneolensis]|nr:amidase [Hellea balneolensis]
FVGACTPAADHTQQTELTPQHDYTAHDWVAKTLPELSSALQKGEISAEDLTKAYLARIEAIDRAGPGLQSVLAVNPDALAQAKALDARRARGETLGPLHGIPVLLKDNIETKDNMATTAGALALKDNITGRDSPLVAGLRDAGAIILGKTNLSQWANFRSESSMSGWSALGGQVRNPHMLDRNTCGSSAGSGAAMAASLAAGTVGTETNGSIICPSTINGVVGFKPSVGLVSQQYIIPISSSQDTAGPMTKTVKGAAMMLGAMAGGAAKTDYVSGLDAGALKGVRLGVMRFSQGENAQILARFNTALKDLEKAGAILVDIDEFEPVNTGSQSYDVLKYEFKSTLNAYLADAAPAVQTRTLADLIAFNKDHADVELSLFDQSIFVASQALGDLNTPAYKDALVAVHKATREQGIDALLAKYDVRALVGPSGPVAGRVDPINGDLWPDWAGSGSMAAIAGYPHLTIPMGDIHGLPIGLSIMGAMNADAQILAYGYAYEQNSHRRVDPKYLKTAEDRPEIAKAMRP